MKLRLCAMIPAAFCAACAGAPPVPPPAARAGPAAAPPAGEVPRLYNDFINRLPCPEQANCGRGPEQPLSAVRCGPSPAPEEVACVFLVSPWAKESDRTYRCEGVFGRTDGAWTMTGFAGPCRLVNERPRTRWRFSEVPERRTVEEIESGFALQEDLMTVGVVDSDEMNRNSRVKIRRLSCTPTSPQEASCTYEASRCLEGETDGNGDGWCRRRANFQVDFAIGHSLTRSRGWTIDRAVAGR
jgi:hypothetical protein